MEFRLEDLLHKMVEKGASDLHVKAGSPPGFRIDGRVVPQEEFGRLSPDITRALAYQILTKDQVAVFERDGDLDCSHAIKDLARFRVNVLTQRNSVGMVIRVIPDRIPTAEDLRLPPICLELALKPRGLVLVTGPTG
ncbi:MAG: type IV pili twitching motility protein PilT, partial [Planctomycetes bacterium]|nr:type IV pili twitching motility protein PilT [Planctomycetota bacterium]